jgi:uncharacterized protein YacL
MTRMLYTVFVMNDKSIFPESVQLGKHSSFRADLKLNAWAFVAVAFAIVSRISLRHHADWPLLSRAIIALSPLLPSLLYVRSIANWIRSMDELQRRIQLEACLFATIGTIFITTAYNLLSTHGIYLSRLPHGLDWEDTFASVILFYILGNFISNRRYK